MKRRLLNLVTVLSLLLCVAAAVLWVRARRTGETVVWSVGNRFHLVLCSHRPGWVEVTGVSNPRRVSHRYSQSMWMTGNPGGCSWHVRSRASGRLRVVGGSVSVWRPPEAPQRPYGAWSAPLAAFEFATPLDYLAVATGVLPAVWVVRRGLVEVRGVRRWRLSRRGLCPSCGYDVRASGERCPECGRAPEAVAAPASVRLWVAVRRPRRRALTFDGLR